MSCSATTATATILHGLEPRSAGRQSVAIVGPSGAGKSTIGRLLFRFYDPWGGRILIGGQDIAQVTQESLRARDRHRPAGQRAVQRHDRLQHRLWPRRRGRGGRDRSGDAARRSCPSSNALPHGFDTQVGERGLKLSGGEKQRVAIARTLVKNPPILLLDEATSALDTRTEQEILATLRRIAQDRTTISIAHRLSTIADSDLIYVMQEGRLAEQGRISNCCVSTGSMPKCGRAGGGNPLWPTKPPNDGRCTMKSRLFLYALVPLTLYDIALASGTASDTLEVRHAMVDGVNPATLEIWDVGNNALADDGELDPARMTPEKWTQLETSAQRLKVALGIDAAGSFIAFARQHAPGRRGRGLDGGRAKISRRQPEVRAAALALAEHAGLIADAAKARDCRGGRSHRPDRPGVRGLPRHLLVTSNRP